jgi:hypothetical protein
MPYPALGPVRGSSAYRSQAVRRVTGSGPGKMTGVTVVCLVQHGEKEPGPGDPGLTELGRRFEEYGLPELLVAAVAGDADVSHAAVARRLPGPVRTRTASSSPAPCRATADDRMGRIQACSRTGRRRNAATRCSCAPRQARALRRAPTWVLT